MRRHTEGGEGKRERESSHSQSVQGNSQQGSRYYYYCYYTTIDDVSMNDVDMSAEEDVFRSMTVATESQTPYSDATQVNKETRRKKTVQKNHLFFFATITFPSLTPL